MISDENVLNKNFSFSKTLKEIDFSLKFKDLQEQKSLFILSRLKKEKLEKLELLKRKYNHNEIIFNLKKAYEDNQRMVNNYKNKDEEENNKNEENPKNELPNLFYSDKIENQEYKKKEEIKLFLDDSDENNKGIDFENIWREEYKKKFNDNNDKKKDIFDKKYRKTVKKKNIYKTKILEKIKENHLKVQKKLKIHQELMKKYSEKKYYTPNYSILDKHTPAIRLNSTSNRIFPYKFIKLNNNSTGKILRNKLFKISFQKLNKSNYYINPCSLLKKYNNSLEIQNDSISTSLSKSIINKDIFNSSFLQGIHSKNRSFLDAKKIKL